MPVEARAGRPPEWEMKGLMRLSMPDGTIPAFAEPAVPNQTTDYASAFGAFESIRRRRSFERRCLPFLKTVIDFDITCEVGYNQLLGRPLIVKQLLLLKLGPPVSVLRRLDRLCEARVITRTRSPSDGRVHELRLTAEVLRLYWYTQSMGEMPTTELMASS